MEPSRPAPVGAPPPASKPDHRTLKAYDPDAPAARPAPAGPKLQRYTGPGADKPSAIERYFRAGRDGP